MHYVTFSAPGLCLFSSLLCWLSSPMQALAEEVALPFSTANELMAAVGRIRLTTARLQDTLQHCQARFPHLAESANHAHAEWVTRNRSAIRSTESVANTVYLSVKQEASAFVAEKMALEMDAVIDQSVQQSTREFADQPRKQQHYLCNRLILSIAAGEHDLAQTNPVELRRVMEFKQ